MIGCIVRNRQLNGYAAGLVMVDTASVQDTVVREFLEEKLDDIRREFEPEHIIVFGSRSVGRAREDSDIDLVVVSERFQDVPFPNRMGEFLRALWPKQDVEVFCYTPEEFEEMRNRIGIVAEAAREGIWIQ